MIHILLPCYNEGEALGAVFDGVARTLADGDFRLWVVDDGSTDDTAGVALKAAAGGLPVTLLSHPVNRGLGRALQTGLERVVPALAGKDVLVVLDADNTHPPQLIPRLTAPIEEGRADLSIASRFAPGGETVGVPLLRRLTSLGARLLFSALFPIPGVRDYTCGFRAYGADILRRGLARWPALVTEGGFAASVEWLLRLSVLKPRVEEVPLVLRYDRKPGPSKMPVWETIRRTLAVLGRLRDIRAS